MMKSVCTLTCLVLMLVMLGGCAMVPSGVAPSNTPINGRKYEVLGPARTTDSRVYLLGLLPITGENSTRDAIEQAVESRKGDALINITVEFYSQWWILFSRSTTRVEGDVIRFQ